jgi:uncharacterized surface protein with fasciclin (FAS1) repeats
MSRFSTPRRLALLAVCGFALAGCATRPTPVTVAETVAANPNLTTLNRLVAQAGLADTLKGAGPFTLFAPSDEAFKAVPAKTLDEIGKNPERLKEVLSFHVLPAKLMAADVKNSSIKTVNGANVALSKAGEFVTIEDGMTQKADIAASNGVVHVIDRVLIPPAKK